MAALCDEIAFWPTRRRRESRLRGARRDTSGHGDDPQRDAAVRQRPYARRGALWDAHRRHFGKDGDPILVWQADTRTMNPTVAQRVVDEAMDRDPASAAAEYGRSSAPTSRASSAATRSKPA